MATATSTTTRRGVLAAVAAAPVAALALCGTAASASAPTFHEITALLKDVTAKRDRMFEARLHYADQQWDTRYQAFKAAQFEYEWALEQLLEAGEAL